MEVIRGCVIALMVELMVAFVMLAIAWQFLQ